jgi:hypothetical protein
MRTTSALFLVATVGCASSPTVGGVSTSTNQVVVAEGTVAVLSTIAESSPAVEPLAASPEGAFAQVAGTYAELGIPLTIISPAAMLAGNQGFNVRHAIGGVAMRNYLLCGDDGTGPNADTYQISMNIATQITKEADGTSKAATVMDATATPMSMGSNLIRCSTTGELEKRVNAVLATRLNLRK